MLGKDDRAHVGLIYDHIDDCKLGVWEVLRNCVQCGAPAEAGHDDRVGASFGKTTDRLLTLCIGADFEFAVRAACFVGPTLRAVEGCFIEGFVELAAEVKDDCWIGQRCTGRKGQRGSGAKDVPHHCHWYLPNSFLAGAFSPRQLPGEKRSSCVLIGQFRP